MSKACSKCGVVKEFSEFSKDKHKASGITSQCKACRKEGRKRWLETPEGREKWNSMQRERYAKNKEAGRARRYAIAAKKPWLGRFHGAVHYAVSVGKIPPAASMACVVGEGCRGNIHYHHDSYIRGNELNVRPMCARHHKLWHLNNDVITPW
jgi:hypothetical protein